MTIRSVRHSGHGRRQLNDPVSPSAIAAAQDECGRLLWGNRIERHDKQTVTRIDYQHSASQSIFGRGPAYWNLDMALSRIFGVGTQQIELRVEAFNVTNAVIPVNSATSLAAPNFGRITTARDPRIMQSP